MSAFRLLAGCQSVGLQPRLTKSTQSSLQTGNSRDHTSGSGAGSFEEDENNRGRHVRAITATLLGLLVLALPTGPAAAGPIYRLTALGTLGGSVTVGLGINSTGQVTGYSMDTAGDKNAFLFSGGSINEVNVPVCRPGNTCAAFMLTPSPAGGATIPEPGTLPLMCVGLMVLACSYLGLPKRAFALIYWRRLVNLIPENPGTRSPAPIGKPQGQAPLCP